MLIQKQKDWKLDYKLKAVKTPHFTLYLKCLLVKFVYFKLNNHMWRLIIFLLEKISLRTLKRWVPRHLKNLNQPIKVYSRINKEDIWKPPVPPSISCLHRKFRAGPHLTSAYVLAPGCVLHSKECCCLTTSGGWLSFPAPALVFAFSPSESSPLLCL